MYQLKPVSARVAAMREKYRTTQPEVCTARYRLITDFYMQNPRHDRDSEARQKLQKHL